MHFNTNAKLNSFGKGPLRSDSNGISFLRKGGEWFVHSRLMECRGNSQT